MPININTNSFYRQKHNLIVIWSVPIKGLILIQTSMRTVPENFNILVIEDNPSDFFLIEQMLLSSKLRIKKIYPAERMSEALELLREQEISLVLLDLSLPDSFGIDSFLEIKHFAQKIPVIILTGLADSELALEALKQNAQDYLVKGNFDSNLLIRSIEYSIERKKAEEIVLASEEKYRQIFYKNPFPMWINDAKTLAILEVNDAAIQKYGYDRKEFLALTLKDIQQFPIDISNLTLYDAMPFRLWNHQKKNGEVIKVEFTYSPINYFGRIAMQAQINDVTEKIRMENELALKKTQIIEAVLNAQEAERRGLGIELHDNINQILTSVKLNLGFALEHPDKRTEVISRCMSSTSLAIEEIRKLSKSLILSGNLKELGLVHSIEELIKDIAPVIKIKITLNSKHMVETAISEEQKITLYRIIQEQLNNILKHAHASSVDISLNTAEGQVSVLIADDGRGFDTNAYRSGIGITNIISRAELFNGKVNIDSSPGHGCRLEVLLHPKILRPLEAA